MLPAVHHALKSRPQPPQVRKHASSIRTLVLLGVAAMFCAVLAPISALWLLQLAEVDRSNDAVLTWGASEAAHLDQSPAGGIPLAWVAVGLLSAGGARTKSITCT